MFIEMQNVGSGGVINPTDASSGYIAQNGTATYTVDLTKTYIIALCAHYNTNGNYMDIYEINKGILSTIHDSPSTPTVSINGTTFTMQNTSSALTMSYCITQLD